MKKPKYDWHLGPYGRIICENGDTVLNICTYGDRPNIMCFIRVAYFETPHEAVWRGGHKVGYTGPGWRYGLSAWVGGGWSLLSLDGGKDQSYICADSTPYATRQAAIKGALHEFVTECDRWLQIPSDSSRAYHTHYGLISRPGREQLAYYLCMPEWEPMWLLLEEYLKYDDWLIDVRTPKTTQPVQQLALF
ncbi:hypothetical protein DYU11_11645 [Fibrisoma montanum]|uniref:Uncharacterized protein n=1 Tax=Fibrisoma montanum TaxID=2305895 RepID=A0A418MB87_9BACT|nr:hypothetical protein [Fibrisoma montanum]RIV23628.1 hypothetical protein DYU11_11645 [Fibrisoma montanum]